MQWATTHRPATTSRKLRLDRRLLPTDTIDQSVTDGLDRNLLAESFWNSLPFSSYVHKYELNRAELVTAYQASHRKLVHARAEIDHLFSAVARASLEIRDNSTGSGLKKRDEYRRKLADIRQTLSFDFSQDKPLSKNELLAFPLELAELRVAKRLRSDIEQLLEALAEKLDHLVADRKLGEITWNNDDSCTFHYFGEVLIRKELTISARSERNTFRQGLTEITTDDKLTVALHRTAHRTVRHEHRLEDAKLVSLSQCAVSMPREIGQVINAIPAWLKPVAGIAVGECVHERIIEHDVSESVEEEIIGRESVRTERYIDPAIVIGKYVLTGWGEREVTAAEKCEARALTVAQREMELQAVVAVSNSHRSIGFLAIFAGLVLFALLITSSPPLPAVGIGGAVGGVLLVSYSIYLRASVVTPAPGTKYFIALGAQLAFAVGAAFAAVATIILGNILPLGLAALFGFAFLSARRLASE